MKKKLLAMIIMLCIVVSLMGTNALAYAEMNVTVDGISMLLNSEYDASIIPSGFYEVAHEYEGETFYGGTDDETSTIDLYFITCDSDPTKSGWYTLENGSFVLYQNLDGQSNIGGTASGDDGTVSITATLTGSTINGRAVDLQVATPGSETTVPTGYVEASVAADNAYVTAYQKEDASGAALDAYLVYGTIDGSSFAWYVYDQAQETIQRYMNNAESQVVDQQEDIIDELKTELEDLNTKYNNNVGRSKNMFIIACIFAVLFLFLMINAFIKRKHIEKDLEDRIVDLMDNGGEETQIFTKGERRRFDRMDAAARDRADRHYDRTVGEDEYNYPTYGEEHAKRVAQRAPQKADSGRYPDKAPEAPYDDDLQVVAGATTEMKTAKPAASKAGIQNRRDERIMQKAPKYDEGDFFDDDDQEDDLSQWEAGRSKNSYFKDDEDNRNKPARRPVSEDPSRTVTRQESREPVKRTLAKESDLDRNPAAVPNRENLRPKSDPVPSRETTRVRSDSVFTEIHESTQDMENAMKRIRSDRNPANTPSGETMDFDLDLLEKNLGRMTSEAMDAPKPERKPVQRASHEMSEIKKTPNFDSDFVNL